MTQRDTSIWPDRYRDLLDVRAFAQVATIGPAGSPHVNPISFLWDGEFLYFTSAPGTQKVKNLRRDARLSLSIMDPANPRRYLEIRGEARRIAVDPTHAIRRRLLLKYFGTEDMPDGVDRDDWVIVTVAPHHATFIG